MSADNPFTEFKRIASDDAFEIWEPPYKAAKDLPPDHALVIAGEDPKVELQCPQHIGPGLDYWFENFGIEEFDPPPGPGFWIWEGSVESKRYDTVDGTDYDVELEGTYRRLTEEEKESLFTLREDVPWDPKDWIDPEKERAQDAKRKARAVSPIAKLREEWQAFVDETDPTILQTLRDEHCKRLEFGYFEESEVIKSWINDRVRSWLNTHVPNVRYRVHYSLGRLGDNGVVILEATQDRVWELRLWATHAIR